jgi:two-component system response regulator YesN
MLERSPGLWTVVAHVEAGWALLAVAEEHSAAEAGRTVALSLIDGSVARVGPLFAHISSSEGNLRAALGGAGAARPQHKAIVRARRIMQERLAEPLSLSAVAGQVGLTPTYLSHLFHAETGQPFQEHLRALRLQQAVHLLEQGEMSVGAVRQACGYEDAGHFARLVRGRTGLTPGEIRRRVSGRIQVAASS